ncbi:MAG: glycosyltransferase [Xanthobacteraceae bacterium]|nr:glycosyltransferase [Xanthobacteraceae bacterium]
MRPIAIIVPVHNGAAAFEACLDSLVAFTTGDCRLVIVNDASTDPRVEDLLSRVSNIQNITVLTNKTNRGYTKSINLGLKAAADCDVILLNSDTVVSPYWSQGLRAAAYSKPGIGTATPISNNAGLFSVPEQNTSNTPPAWLPGNRYPRAIRQAMPGWRPEVPTGNGFCLYIKHDCLKEVGAFDARAFPRGYGEENDFCMRAWRKGWKHVIDDKTFIRHAGAASFGAEREKLIDRSRLEIDRRYPEYGQAIKIFDSSEKIKSICHVARALNGRQFSSATGRPRILYVISTDTGGTPQTNLDLMGQLGDDYEPWLLRCNGRLLELSRIGPAASVVATHTFQDPVTILTHRSDEYDDVIAKWLIKYAIELVHVRHIAWHSLGLIDRACRLGIPIVYSFHDFYSLCPTVKLLDNDNEFCGGHCTPGAGVCKIELWPQSDVPPLKHAWVNVWRSRFEAALMQCDAFVTTDESARAILTDNFPWLLDRPFVIIPHGRDFPRYHRKSTTSSRGDRPVRILVPGNISDAKGARHIRAIRDADSRRTLEFHILGNRTVGLEGERIVLHGAYQRDDFAALARDIDADLGAIFSIWPETYCHTLTELWSIGLPVLAFDFGAVGNRIRASGGGWFLPKDDPVAIVRLINGILSDPAGYNRKIKAVGRWQAGHARDGSVRQMADRYLQLYDDVFERRRAFRHRDADRLLTQRG